VAGAQVVITSRPLTFDAGVLALGDPETERVNWRKDGVSLAPSPEPGETISAHWDWACGTITDDESAALESATKVTLDLVNSTWSENLSVVARSAHTRG
jgi:hypothetical protein